MRRAIRPPAEAKPGRETEVVSPLCPAPSTFFGPRLAISAAPWYLLCLQNRRKPASTSSIPLRRRSKCTMRSPRSSVPPEGATLIAFDRDVCGQALRTRKMNRWHRNFDFTIGLEALCRTAPMRSNRQSVHCLSFESPSPRRASRANLKSRAALKNSRNPMLPSRCRRRSRRRVDASPA